MNKKYFLIFLAMFITVLMSTTAFAEYDLGGATVNYVTFVTYVFDDFPEIQERMAEAEEKFNCEINIVRSSWGEDIEEMTTRFLAGESEYDIWRVDTNSIFSMAADDMLYPLDTALSQDYYDSLPDVARTIIDATEYKGHKYGIGASDYSNALDGLYFLGYNVEKFEEAGLPDPYEQYLEGEWTWSSYEVALDTFTEDTDGDGEIDHWAIDFFHAQTMVISNGGSFSRVDEEGNILFNGTDEKVIDTLNQIQEWNAKGYAAGWGEHFFEGQTAMIDGPLWRTREQDTDFTMGVVPYPKGPGADDYSFPLFAFNLYAIPANSAAPEALVAIHDYLWPPEEAEDNFLDTTMVWYRNRQAYEMVMTGVENWNLDDTLTYYGYMDIAEDIDTVINEGENPTTVMNSIEPEVQARLDDLFNN
ncbi:MAG: ABC transporter substrate-binding protein [bacterium]